MPVCVWAQVYGWFLGVYKVSKFVGVIGYVMLLFEMLGGAILLRLLFPAGFSIDLIWWVLAARHGVHSALPGVMQTGVPARTVSTDPAGMHCAARRMQTPAATRAVPEGWLRAQGLAATRKEPRTHGLAYKA